MSARKVHVVLKVDASRFVAELAHARESVDRLDDRLRRVYLTMWTYPLLRRTGPARLPINGHEYRRRRRARRAR